jgi:hypothetical protein
MHCDNALAGYALAGNAYLPQPPVTRMLLPTLLTPAVPVEQLLPAQAALGVQLPPVQPLVATGQLLPPQAGSFIPYWLSSFCSSEAAGLAEAVPVSAVVPSSLLSRLVAGQLLGAAMAGVMIITAMAIMATIETMVILKNLFMFPSFHSARITLLRFACSYDAILSKWNGQQDNSNSFKNQSIWK